MEEVTFTTAQLKTDPDNLRGTSTELTQYPEYYNKLPNCAFVFCIADVR